MAICYIAPQKRRCSKAFLANTGHVDAVLPCYHTYIEAVPALGESLHRGTYMQIHLIYYLHAKTCGQYSLRVHILQP
jgi:hypothetical protein